MRVLLSLDLFLLGVSLILVPWLGYWDHNYFLDKFPGMIPYLLHPSVRGAVTGLGILDILLSGSVLRSGTDAIAPPTT